MLLLVDQNEAATSPKTIEALRKHFTNVALVNSRIDVQIPLEDGTKIAIERKTPSDFISSIGDGRLKEEIERMHSVAKFCAVVVTGRINYAGNGFVRGDGIQEERKWKSTSVRGMLRAIQLSGTILEWCPVNYYAQMIEEIYTTCSSEDHRQGLKKERIITFPPIDERIQFLGQLCDFGIESAKQLLHFAGTLDQNADEDGFGTVASALHYLSIMGQFPLAARPKLFRGKRGVNKILSNRKLLGLASNQYLAIITETEFNKKEYSSPTMLPIPMEDYNEPTAEEE